VTEIKSIKLAADVFDNRKIKQIEAMAEGDTLIVIWLKLLTLAGTTNDGGRIYFTREMPYTEQMLAVQLGRPSDTVRIALSTFCSFGMIDVDGDFISVKNWERYQGDGETDCTGEPENDERDRIREQNRIRKRKQRERENHLSDACHASSRGCNLTDNVTDNVTDSVTSLTEKQERETETEKEKAAEKEKEKDKEKEKKERECFRPPAPEEVEAYCDERGNGIDARHFVDYYSSNGWKVGRNPMKDWKAAVRSWEQNGYGGSRTRGENSRDAPQVKMWCDEWDSGEEPAEFEELF
jgi:predicted phage replisome organizer